MPAFGRREFAGAAPSTTLSSDITSGAGTITLVSGSGYPTGGTGPFYIVIDPGLAGEEKVLCAARSGNTITVSARGADATAASAHSTGAVVQHIVTAVDLDESNQHLADPTLDHHTQYLNTARHAAIAHTSGMIATDAVITAKILDGSVTLSKMAANSVDSSKIVDGSIAGADIATGAVTSANIADGTIAAADMGVGSVTSSAILDGTIATGDLADGAVTSAKILDGTVGPADIATGGVWTPNIADGNVTLAKMAVASVDNSKVVSGYALPPTTMSTYTPTISQVGGAVGATVLVANYVKIGPLTIVQLYYAITGVGSGAGTITVPLPVTAAAGAAGVAGAGDYTHGVQHYVGVMSLSGSTTAKFQMPDALGVAPAFANGDVFTAFIAYLT